MELKVEVRSIKKKKNKYLRQDGVIPAIVYGKSLDNPMVISCNKNDFVRLYKQAGYSTPVTLKGDGIEQMVLVHEVQLDPVYDTVLHVDFLAIKKGEKVEAEVPVNLTGEAPVEKLGEGNVQQLKNSIQVVAIPSKLPQEILVDISGLETTKDVIFIKDLPLPDDVETHEDPEIAVVTVMSISNIPDEEEEIEAEKSEEGSEEVNNEGEGDEKDEENKSE